MIDRRTLFYRELGSRIVGKSDSLPWWQPIARQQQALASEADELLYGGAAVGGKTELMAVIGWLGHRVTLILRRMFPELKRNLIPRTKAIYRDTGTYNGSDKRWTSHSGRVVQFGHMQKAEDYLLYKSDEYDCIGFDELTEFTEAQYLYMFSRLRSSSPGQRSRMISGTNPGNLGSSWVFERWAAWLDPRHPNPAKPGELRWYARIKGKDTEVAGPEPFELDGETVTPLSRTFIPSFIDDNPHADPAYRAKLQSMPEPWRSQLLKGDWLIGRRDEAGTVIPASWVRAAMDRWAADHRPPGLPVVGVDVARGGDDQTVLALRVRNWFAEMEAIPGVDTPTANEVLEPLALLLRNGGHANVDVGNIGAAVVDLGQARGMALEAINFGAGTEEMDRTGNLEFANMRAMMYWRMRELLDPERPLDEGELPPELPPDPELLVDLTSQRVKPRAGGAIQLEKKEDIKKRIGRSPDKGDAAVLTCIMPIGQFDVATYLQIMSGKPAKAK